MARKQALTIVNISCATEADVSQKMTRSL